MAIKLVDELKAMGNFPIAHAEGINLVKTDGTEDNLQNLFDNGELGGGGGDSSVTLTQQEYEALSEEQKLNGLYYTYDTKRIYKNGVQYGASDAEGIGYNNAESGIQATTVQGAIDKVVKTVEDAYAKKTEIPTTLPANGGNANTVNNHTVKSDVPENAVFTDTVYDDTEVKGSIENLSSKLGEKVDYKVVVEDGTRYVEDIVVQDINTWLPNNNSSIVINLKKVNGVNYSNFQLLCNKQDSKNWTCIVIGGVSTFWRICYVNGVRYIEEIAAMDKVAKYPDWSNQQTISMTEITVDQDVYIELNQLNSSPMEALKINGKDVSVSDSQNELYSTRFSGYVKKGSVVSHPYLTNTNVVRVFPLV